MKRFQTASLSSRLGILAVVFILIIIFISQLSANPLDQKLPLMRFPDIHGNTVVFVHGEDIWKASADGGIATRLTIHDGAERFPKF